MITKRELSRSGEIADAYLLQFCSQKILGYQERLSQHDISDWTGGISDYPGGGDAVLGLCPEAH